MTPHDLILWAFALGAVLVSAASSFAVIVMAWRYVFSCDKSSEVRSAWAHGMPPPATPRPRAPARPPERNNG